MLHVANLAQIREGKVEFGDFTLLVGPQASGKSIFLQLFKLIQDQANIAQTLKTNGFTWGKEWEKLFELYFGESMSGIWKPDTTVNYDGKRYESQHFLPKPGPKNTDEHVLYIPAQRVVTMSQGWPRNFGAFDIGDPYVLKTFSETIRVLMEKETVSLEKGTKNIFPQNGQLKESLRNLLDDSIFHGATIELDSQSMRKRFLLNVADSRLPFMTWSAGQKEFMPLLLSLYHLMPSSKVSMRDDLKWVIIEEPEMGLHPQAIQALMVVFLELIHRGYKIVVSTHSPVLLELAWTMTFLKQYKGTASDLFTLFGLKKSQGLQSVFQQAIENKTFSTYYFERQPDGVYIRDISSLDAGSEVKAVAEWGGLSTFAGRAGEVVATLAAQH